MKPCRIDLLWKAALHWIDRDGFLIWQHVIVRGEVFFVSLARM
jgi:hypothetical protein